MVLVRQLPAPTEGIKLQGCGVEAFVDNEGHGRGSLFVTESNIAWINSDSGEGFKVGYKKMTLHAISRDPGVHSKACLYIMVNGNVLDEDDNFEVESPINVTGGEADEGEEEMTEIRFVPEEDSALDEMYKAVQECSLLHPDTASDMSNEEEDPDEMFEGYVPPAGEGNGGGDEDELGEEEEEEDEETRRLEEFMRLQLRFPPRENGDDDEDENGGNNGNGRLNFVPAPGQFDDA